jgi:hypothetical protein
MILPLTSVGKTFRSIEVLSLSGTIGRAIVTCSIQTDLEIYFKRILKGYTTNFGFDFPNLPVHFLSPSDRFRQKQRVPLCLLVQGSTSLFRLRPLEAVQSRRTRN